MSGDKPKIKLTPVQEGLVGAVIGALLGGALWLGGIISPNAIAGVSLGLGAGSWFNGWRRSQRDD